MKTLKKHIIPLLLAFLLVSSGVVYAVILMISYENMRESLYEERSVNVSLLEDKVVRLLQSEIDHGWENLYHFRETLAEQDLNSVEDARRRMLLLREHLPNEYSKLFFVDSRGLCYFSDGDPFRLEREEVLSADNDGFYASSYETSMGEKEQARLYFVTPMKESISIENITITHIGACVEMSFIESYFDTTEYGENSIALVLHSNGDQLYLQENKINPLSGERNVLSALSNAAYHYGTSYEMLCSDIEEGQAGCLNLTYEDQQYYVVYKRLGRSQLTSMLIIGQENVGIADSRLVASVMTSIITIAAGAVVLLVIIGWISMYNIGKHRNEVNRQLIRAAEAERNANNAKTQFLSSMSHDIRTPMNAIVGMTTLAIKHIDDTAYVKNCLVKATLASNHLLTLINDVLDISKVESGKMTLNPSVFSLAETATNLINIIRPQIDAKNQMLDVRIHNLKREYLFADELRVNQIFINILSNAVKYTPEGGHIKVDIKEEDCTTTEFTRLIYVVEDSGIGMSEAFQQTMYQAFTRDQSEKSSHGTGLGLAICKQMVDLMGGTIECDSQVGRGTKFTVTLDLEVADHAMDELLLPALDLLLVDDDEIFLETASDTFADMGVSVECVTSGEAAVAAVDHRHQIDRDYQVIVIDWRMPGMDGIETTKAIRAKVGPDVSIIVISAYAPEEIEEDLKAAGANGFIYKPFFRSTLHKSLREILGIDSPDTAESHHEQRSFEGMKILIAEDNELNWEIAHAILAMYGVETERAENGRICCELMRAADDGEYDMILMDIQMPEMNGYEATAAIRNSNRAYLQNIPIVAMTADAFAEDIQKCMESGMNAHLPKPIDINKLMEIIGNSGGGGRPYRLQ